MAILAAYALPHPPIVIPEIGGDRLKGTVTSDSMLQAAEMIAERRPETIVLVTPHSVMYSDYIHISPGRSARGSLTQFGLPWEFAADYDEELVRALETACGEAGFPAGTLGEKSAELDHGSLVPLYFITQRVPSFKLVRVSASGLTREQHYEFGVLLSAAIGKLGRRAVLVASGDMSHKLSDDGPYGYAGEGPVFDGKICGILESGKFGELFSLDEALCEGAAECGLAGLLVLAGAFDKLGVLSRLLSYEGPFGVGYAVAEFEPAGWDDARGFLAQARAAALKASRLRRAAEDEYVRLARASIEHYLRHNAPQPEPQVLPAELTRGRAGAFVSIKKAGRLRGCIGTTGPTRPTLAQEIIENAVAAAARDPRFDPITEDELPLLDISVDVLTGAVPCGKEELDPKRYGVIVGSGYRRGLLLPDLDGVDTVERQLKIACEKAEIDPGGRYEISRFGVVRHV